MWFRVDVTNAAGSHGFDTALYWGKFPHVPGVSSLITFISNHPQPGETYAIGPYELTDLSSWQSLFTGMSCHTHTGPHAETASQEVFYSATSTGPWTSLGVLSNSTEDSSGTFGLIITDLSSAFGVGTGYCAYGTERQPGVTEALQMSAGVVAGLGLGTGEIWTIPILAGIYGSTIIMDQICGSQKQPDQTVDLADWSTPASSGVGTVAAQKVISNFRNKLWDAYCRCTPAPSGSPGPVTPPVTILLKPTYLTTIDNIQIDNTEISTTINQLWQYFLSLNIGNNNSISIGQQIAECTCSKYKVGASHPGLSGDGELAVSGILGLAVNFTTLPDRIGVAIGDPDTLYTGAWVNIGSIDGWFERHFPNTDPWIAFPARMNEMTKIGYSIPADVVLTISELVQA